MATQHYECDYGAYGKWCADYNGVVLYVYVLPSESENHPGEYSPRMPGGFSGMIDGIKGASFIDLSGEKGCCAIESVSSYFLSNTKTTSDDNIVYHDLDVRIVKEEKTNIHHLKISSVELELGVIQAGDNTLKIKFQNGTITAALNDNNAVDVIDEFAGAELASVVLMRQIDSENAAAKWNTKEVSITNKLDSYDDEFIIRQRNLSNQYLSSNYSYSCKLDRTYHASDRYELEINFNLSSLFESTIMRFCTSNTTTNLKSITFSSAFKELEYSACNGMYIDGDLTFRGAKLGRNSLYGVHANSITLSNCTLYSYALYGAVVSENISITDCTFESDSEKWQSEGHLQSITAKEIKIKDCSFKNNRSTINNTTAFVLEIVNTYELGYSFASSCYCNILKFGWEYPEQITPLNIPSSAFEYNPNLMRVEIAGYDETTLNERSFSYCQQLKSFECRKLVALGNGAFSLCSVLEDIRLDNVQKIGSNAFGRCEMLTSANLENCNSIDSNAFSGCKNMSSISIGSKCYSISSGAFDFGEGDDANVNSVVSIRKRKGSITGEPWGANVTASTDKPHTTLIKWLYDAQQTVFYKKTKEGYKEMSVYKKTADGAVELTFTQKKEV